MKLCILSDTHYISPRIMEDGGETLLRKGERLGTVLKPIMVKQAFEQVSAESDYDTVLITGDLTNWGDKPSHEDFREMLRELKSKGKRVLVTVATHDFHHGHPYVQMVRNSEIAYTQTPWEMTDFDVQNTAVKYRDCVAPEFRHLTEDECKPVLFEAMPLEELSEFYREFGIDESISCHAPSGSYCAQLDEKTRVIMLNDNFRDIDATGNTSVTYSHTCFRWIRKMLDEAKRDGMFIFACTHHPLVPPVPAYKLGATDKNMRKPSVGHALADMGLKLVFSGHTHFCNAAYIRSEKGNVLYDITTPSAQVFPAQFRKAEINPETGDVSASTTDVGEIPESIRGNETTKDFLRNMFFDDYRNKIANMNGFIGKTAREITCGKLLFLVNHSAKLTPSEAEKIKNIKVFELVLQLAENMLAGDGSYTPDTPEYKFVMGLCAVADSVIDAQPFLDIKKKKLMGYSLRNIAEPMLFNNCFSDSETRLCVFDDVKNRYITSEFSSPAGKIFMSALSLISLLLSPIELFAVICAIPTLSAKKITKLKQIKNLPHDIYAYDLS